MRLFFKTTIQAPLASGVFVLLIIAIITTSGMSLTVVAVPTMPVPATVFAWRSARGVYYIKVNFYIKK